MVSTGEFRYKGLPRAIPIEGLPLTIPADQLQIMLGTSSAFRSWDAANSTIDDITTGWRYLFAKPLLGTN
jgi:hypothetical protein